MRSFIFATTLACSLQQVLAQTQTFDNVLTVGPVDISFVAGASGLDAPHISAVNDSSFDWWYFDAISPNSNESVSVILYLATADAFPYVNPGTAIQVDIFATLANGTQIYLPVNDVNGTQGSAVITTDCDGASGTWESTGFSFTGSPDAKKYTVNIDAPEIGVSGSMTINSVAPSAYACGAPRPGLSTEVAPGLGWSNAVPDADAVVDFTIGGAPVSFSGIGYHDQNWGGQPIFEIAGSWFWGHARVGPYSIVFFDGLTPAGDEFNGGYIAKDGKLVSASCQPKAAVVRPTGPGDLYPPSNTTGLPTGLDITVDAGSEGTLHVVVSNKEQLAGFNTFYNRWTGIFTGGIVGGPQYTGFGVFEELNNVALVDQALG